MMVATALDQFRNFPERDFYDAFRDQSVMILAPHPDDESLGCGGLIAEACRRGNPPVVVILTDGSKSHPNSGAYSAERLRALREEEAAEAVGTLGLPRRRLVFLRYTDSAAPCEGLEMLAAAGRIAALIEAFGCTVLAAPWRHDPHCDHEAAAAIAKRACGMTGAQLLAYPIWGWTLPPTSLIEEQSMCGFRLNIGAHLAVKRAAVEAHRSQYAGIITDDPNGFQMEPAFIEGFLQPTETYIEVNGRV